MASPSKTILPIREDVAAKLLLAIKERDEARAEVAAIKAQHKRILSWPPQDLARADAVIAHGATRLAHVGNQPLAKSVIDALDTTKRHRSQLAAEVDRLRSALDSLERRANDVAAENVRLQADADDGQAAAEMSMAWGQEWEREYRAACAEVERLQARLDRAESDRGLLAHVIRGYIQGKDGIDDMIEAYRSLPDAVRAEVEAADQPAGVSDA